MQLITYENRKERNEYRIKMIKKYGVNWTTKCTDKELKAMPERKFKTK